MNLAIRLLSLDHRIGAVVVSYRNLLNHLWVLSKELKDPVCTDGIWDRVFRLTWGMTRGGVYTQISDEVGEKIKYSVRSHNTHTFFLIDVKTDDYTIGRYPLGKNVKYAP